MHPMLRLAVPAAALTLAGCVSTHTVADETAVEGAAAPVSPPPPSTAPPPATPTEQPHQAPAVTPQHTPPAEAAPPEPAPAGQGLGGVSVRFGIAPDDYSDVEPGVLVGEVYPGTSADLAGLKPGDRMTRWNGKPIPDVEGWMPLLAAAKPGDIVDVTYVRDGKEAVARVTLQPRQ